MSCMYTYPNNTAFSKAYWTTSGTGAAGPDLLEQSRHQVGVSCNHQGRANASCNTNGCSLRLAGVTAADSLTYFCRIITNVDLEKWTGQPGMELSVRELQVNGPSAVAMGESLTLSCDSSCPLANDASYTWTKDGRPIETQPQQGNNSEEYKQSTHRKQLHIEHVTRGDAGNYSCAVEDHGSVSSGPNRVTVLCKPSGKILPGTSVTLTCSSDANPPVENYTWFKMNESTPVGSGQQFTISNIRPEDAGQYYCEARNERGATNSMAFPINVEELQVNGPSAVAMGESLTLSCDSSCPLANDASYTWTKDGRPIETQPQQGNNSEEYKSTHRKQLHIEHVTRGDAGNYSCAVEDHGSVPSRPKRVTVLYPPHDVLVFVRPSGKILPGTSLTLTCSSDANPPVESYTWFKEDESTPVRSGQQFTIFNISSEDA
ncbi:B-cell receptor CD22-like, partial [Engraulis encrasicolus]|uniref:B-cell receptor CD22-like n=1 Tax=Engraulis encrasicolus TaxID=184585 RepID=UPI002FD58B98